MKHRNTVELSIFGDYGLFSNPLSRCSGEKVSLQIPTYEAIKGILSSCYWKPTFIWVVDKIRIMKPFVMETRGIHINRYASGADDLLYCTYLKDCYYQVQAHFVWNENRPEFKEDRNENKHYQIAKKMIQRGGKRDIFLGTRDCQGYIEPCDFGKGKGYYDTTQCLEFGLVYHGITYADEAYDEYTKNRMTANFWYPTMRNGVIQFLRPDECPCKKVIREMHMKSFVD